MLREPFRGLAPGLKLEIAKCHVVEVGLSLCQLLLLVGRVACLEHFFAVGLKDGMSHVLSTGTPGVLA